MTNAEKERERLTRVYGAMSDGELQKIASQAADLTDVAREVLQQEIGHRALLPESTPAATEASPEPETTEGLVTIRQFRDLHEALLAQGTLQSAGIDCFIADDNMVRMNWFWSNLIGGVKLQVRPEDAEGASEVLEQDIPESFDVEGLGAYEQPRCPKCQSLDIGFEEFEKGFALTSAYMMAPVPLRREKWKCHSCGHEWQETEQPRGTGD
jgi:hypothetical protein